MTNERQSFLIRALPVILCTLVHPVSAQPAPYRHEAGNGAYTIPEVVLMVSDTSIASVVRHLESYGSRFALYENRHSIAQWIKEQYLALGITDVVIDSFQEPSYGMWQKNVIATIPGNGSFNEEIILGGHYDSQSSIRAVAPGADDNASGTAGVLEVARVLTASGYQPRATIRFIAFGAEELGLLGSFDYVDKALMRRQNIMLMQNYDMIAYRNQSQPDRNVDINMYWAAESEAILDSVLMRTYTSLTPRLATSQITRSDSWPFALRGYKAIFPIEDDGDFNPHYHSALDSSTYLDFSYAAEIVQSAVALTLTIDATLTSITDRPADVPVGTFLDQNFPNPFNPETRIAFTLASRQRAKIAVFDMLGREVAVLFDGEADAGPHTTRWNALDAPAGTYFCRMVSGGSLQVRRMTLVR